MNTVWVIAQTYLFLWDALMLDSTNIIVLIDVGATHMISLLVLEGPIQ